MKSQAISRANTRKIYDVSVTVTPPSGADGTSDTNLYALHSFSVHINPHRRC